MRNIDISVNVPKSAFSIEWLTIMPISSYPNMTVYTSNLLSRSSNSRFEFDNGNPVNFSQWLDKYYIMFDIYEYNNFYVISIIYLFQHQYIQYRGTTTKYCLFDITGKGYSYVLKIGNENDIYFEMPVELSTDPYVNEFKISNKLCNFNL